MHILIDVDCQQVTMIGMLLVLNLMLARSILLVKPSAAATAIQLFYCNV